MNRISLAIIILLAIVSCKKEGSRPVMKEGVAPALTATQSTLTLSKSDAAKEAVAFGWSPADYGYQAAVKYTLQLDTAGKQFAHPMDVALDNSNQKKYTVADFNDLANKMKLAPTRAEKIEVRVKTEVSTLIPPVYSNTVTLTVTSYEKGTLYLTGSYPGGGDVTTAAKLGSAEDNGYYEGYVNFPDNATTFKFRDAANASNIYGGTAGGGVTAGGDAIPFTGSGFYLFKVNLNTHKWEAEKTDWGLIGSATPGKWDSDTDMQYDPATKVWYAEVNLTAEEIKFRSNDGWDLNYGDSGADKVLDKGGDNIKVTAAGRYRVELDLNVPGSYTYSLRKL